MKTRQLITLASSMLFAFAPVKAYEKRDLLCNSISPDSLKNVLILDQAWVTLPDYSDRAGWDNFFGDLKDDYIREGEKRLNYQWKHVNATDYLEYGRSGNRRIMEDPQSANNSALTALFLAELAEGQGRFLDQIINGVYFDCEMTTWSLSAHLYLQAGNLQFPDHRQNIIDLVVGNTGSQLAWIYYILKPEFDKVTPLISERLRDELQARILDAYMNNDTYWWFAKDPQPGQVINNWNPWCNFNALQCFFLLEPDRDKLAAAVWRSMESVDKFINYTQGDGGCEEGPSYWGHAAGKLYDYLNMLAQGTGGRVSIFDQKLIKDMGEYIVRSYIGNDWVVNFADASAKGGGNAGLIYRYGKAVGSDLMQHHAAALNARKPEGLPLSYDLARTFGDIACRKELAQTSPVYKAPTTSWYPITEVCTMSNKQGFVVAAKGGYNNESHNHNDIGTFSLYVDTVPLFIDAGVGTYTRQTFGPERYTIWTMQSEYHSLPVVNGSGQRFGTQYRARDVKFDAKRRTFSADIAGAYPAEAKVDKWVRSYKLGDKALTIADNFSLQSADEPIRLNFLVRGTVDTATPGRVSIEADGQRVALNYDKTRFTPTVEAIELTDKQLSDVWGPVIYRLTLTAASPEQSGTYSYTINQL